MHRRGDDRHQCGHQNQHNESQQRVGQELAHQVETKLNQTTSTRVLVLCRRSLILTLQWIATLIEPTPIRPRSRLLRDLFVRDAGTEFCDRKQRPQEQQADNREQDAIGIAEDISQRFEDSLNGHPFQRARNGPDVFPDDGCPEHGYYPAGSANEAALTDYDAFCNRFLTPNHGFGGIHVPAQGRKDRR